MLLTRLIFALLFFGMLTVPVAAASEGRISASLYGDRRNPDGSRRDDRGTDMSHVFHSSSRANHDEHDEANSRIGIYSSLAGASPALQKQVTSLSEGVSQLQCLVEKRNRVRDEIVGRDHQDARQELVDTATDSLMVARDYYRNDEFEEGQIAATIADAALDLATSFTPGVSWGRDIYEAVTGKSLIDGEQLDTFSRSTAVLGAVTVGFSSKIGKALGVIRRLAKRRTPHAALAMSESIVNAGRKFGAWAGEEIRAYSSLIGKTGLSRKADAVDIAQYEKLKAYLAVEEIRGTKVIGSAMKADTGHRSVTFMIDTAAREGKLFPLRGGDGVTRNLLQVEGTLNDSKGVFEWIVGQEGLTHQRFIKNGQVTGFANQDSRKAVEI